MEYICKRCGHTAATKGNLLKHLRRKNPCPTQIECISTADYIAELVLKERKDKTWECAHCGRQFNCYQNRWRHMKTCKETGLIQSLQGQAEQIQQLQQRIAKLEKDKHHVTTNINTNTQNIHIHLRDFGQENISYLPKEFLSRCFAEKDLVGLLENIHCDREHPENHNIRVKSQKRNQIETRENNRWMIKDEDEALTDCIQNGYRILVRHGFRHRQEIIEDELEDNEDEYHSVREWLESVYENQHEQKPIKRKLLLLFLNNQALILGKDGE